MASTASSSTSRALPSEAGPLPRKVGELGWPSSASLNLPESEADITESPELPARHPADTPGPARPPSRSQPTPAQSTTAASSTTSLQSTIPQKRTGLLYRLGSSHAPPLFWGLHGPAVIRFTLILLLMCGTITGWVLTAQRLSDANARNDNGTAGKNDMIAQMAGTMGIFVHVAFAVALLVALVFLERAVFQLRAERWLHTHPGETLPLHRGGRGSPSGGGAAMNFAPWNRPPLPTYAAALGFRGTGDVEDDVIAAPPPPAYGNTRGSVLLLSNVLLRISHLSQQMSPRTPRDVQQIPESRPVSYVSAAHDPEVRSDAERARQLEVTLARLEQQGS